MAMIALKGLHKEYRSGKMAYQALKGINIDIEQGEMVSIVGPSGCGKTTMLNMITGIDRPTKGTVNIRGKRIDLMKEDKLARWRGKNVGIVFQFFQLFPTLNALENCMLPMDFARIGSLKERKKTAMTNLEIVGLGDKWHHLPSELSGGEQQRVAIARALANDPEILIGDEPTGNLDSRTESRVFDLFRVLNRSGMTVIFVTHSKDLAGRASRQIRMLDGVIEN
jgi:putative ABC transport system ATP-binding protein